MPTSMQYLASVPLIYVRYDGEVTGDQMLCVAKQIAATHKASRGVPVLADLSSFEDTDLTYTRLAGTVRRMNQIFLTRDEPAPQKTVIWAPGDLAFGMTRMFEAISPKSVRDIRVARTEDEVSAHLSLDPAQVRDLLSR